MKYIILFLLVLTFSSCSNEKEDNTTRNLALLAAVSSSQGCNGSENALQGSWVVGYRGHLRK